jgi:hypothetical protein
MNFFYVKKLFRGFKLLRVNTKNFVLNQVTAGKILTTLKYKSIDHLHFLKSNFSKILKLCFVTLIKKSNMFFNIISYFYYFYSLLYSNNFYIKTNMEITSESKKFSNLKHLGSSLKRVDVLRYMHINMILDSRYNNIKYFRPTLPPRRNGVYFN